MTSSWKRWHRAHESLRVSKRNAKVCDRTNNTLQWSFSTELRGKTCEHKWGGCLRRNRHELDYDQVSILFQTKGTKNSLEQTAQIRDRKRAECWYSGPRTQEHFTSYIVVFAKFLFQTNYTLHSSYEQVFIFGYFDRHFLTEHLYTSWISSIQHKVNWPNFQELKWPKRIKAQRKIKINTKTGVYFIRCFVVRHEYVLNFDTKWDDAWRLLPSLWNCARGWISSRELLTTLLNSTVYRAEYKPCSLQSTYSTSSTQAVERQKTSGNLNYNSRYKNTTHIILPAPGIHFIVE